MKKAQCLYYNLIGMRIPNLTYILIETVIGVKKQVIDRLRKKIEENKTNEEQND